MAVRRSLTVYKACSAATMLAALLCTAIFAQEADDGAVESVGTVQDLPGLDLELSQAAIEEIIVVAPKPGSRRRLDPEVDPMRARLLDELYKMEQIEEESAWRQASIDDSSSRIKWGYNPADDDHNRSEMDNIDTPSYNVNPASVFRVEF